MNLFINNLFRDPQFFFTWLVFIVFSICCHEFMHAYVALKQGDSTAADMGHLTLNPLKQMGLFSLIMLAVAGIAWGAVPVRPYLMRHRHSDALVAFAGPATNLGLFLFCGETLHHTTAEALRERFPREYAYLKEVIYPQLRTVDFRYNLRRKGMVKDTIHTTELDTTYARGVELLQRRQYARALYILNDYNDRNTVVAHLSMDHNERALELLSTMPTDAVTEYLRAIACSRLGRKAEGREHFLEACRRDERMEYRGNLDPEISELLKD